MKASLKDAWQRIRADLVHAHRSLTIWFNSAAGALVLALPVAQEQMPQLQDYLPANLYHCLMGVLVLGNSALRFRTTSALADK